MFFVLRGACSENVSVGSALADALSDSRPTEPRPPRRTLRESVSSVDGSSQRHEDPG